MTATAANTAVTAVTTSTNIASTVDDDAPILTATTSASVNTITVAYTVDDTVSSVVAAIDTISFAASTILYFITRDNYLTEVL